jgi:hypothetical protein
VVSCAEESLSGAAETGVWAGFRPTLPPNGVSAKGYVGLAERRPGSE